MDLKWNAVGTNLISKSHFTLLCWLSSEKDMIQILKNMFDSIS